MARAQTGYKGRKQSQFLVAGTLDLNGVMQLTANSTGIVTADYEASLPGAVDNGLLYGFISNSTGFAMFLNTSGTTHKYFQVTTKQPT